MLIAPIAVAVLLAIIGFYPAKRMVGDDGVMALWIGCSISLFASAAGLAAVAWTISGGPFNITTAILTSNGMRLVVTLVLVAIPLLTTAIHRVAFVVSVTISYLVLLTVDSVIAIQASQRYFEGKSAQ